MKVKMGMLRRFIFEAFDNLNEEAWVPGRWMPGEGEPVSPEDIHNLGEIDDQDLDETDLKIMGDGKGPGDNEQDKLKIADHLRGDDEKCSLGNPPDETVGEALLRRELKYFFLQEGPAGASSTDPRNPGAPYGGFDMARDHGDVEDLSSPWYRSPGRPQGQDGDPYRSPDPYAQLGFHSPKADANPTASPPGADGETGVSSRLTPLIWQLSAGGDTSAVLGANVHPSSNDISSNDESEKGNEGSSTIGRGYEKDANKTKGNNQNQGNFQRSRN